MPKPNNILIYDKACPFCTMYAQKVRLEANIGQLTLINARDKSDYEHLLNKAYDIDKGMILILHTQTYFGADAMHMLALMSSKVGVFNRLNYMIFKSKTLTTFCYPFLLMARQVILKLLNRGSING